MEDWKNRLSALVAEPASVLKWLIFSGLIGLIVGCVSAAFYHAFFWATSARTTHLWLIGLLPLGGVCIVALYRLCGLEKDQGTNFVLVAVRENVPLRLRTAPLVFFSTILTHLVGGSSGREGAILQIGGSISSKVGQWMKLDDKDSRIITMCGMAAAFSALFGTPITAAMFAMEVVSVGVLYYAAIVPCAISSIMGLWVAKLFHVPATAFPLTGIPDLSPVALLQVIVLGVLFALLSILFCRIMHTVPHLYQRFFPNSFLRAAVGGFLVIALTLLVWLWNPFTFDYNGAGESIIHAAVEGHARPEAFLLKMLFTALTLGAGFKGGEIVPVFFTGATFGCTVAPLLGLSPSFGAGLGMVCVFCGVTNCPITSLLIALELFGEGSSAMFTGQSMGLFAVCIAISYTLSGYYGLYKEQKIVYSKFRPEFINKKAD
ncbi:chloride channel protein [Pseudoflavonifractor sp. DSM 107456]|uniref:Chloride channel protein n=1 Tax=Pseudoflavonifractor gallinarum TaxID=2779352 RepID=A0ABR9RCR6_9FIRM|nr:chloride channel protein [Pseudoflavonifractor gallinarum]MBE5056492.1 chloride channel protein [Pseudoflavonifractor gallinarum]